MTEVDIPAKPDPITLDITRTALIVVDMQNAFAKKGGMLDVLGVFNEARANLVIANNSKIIEIFRRTGMPIIYLRMTYGPDLAEAGGPESPNYWKQGGLVAMRHHPEWKGKFLTIGTWDWEIIDELKPLAEEIIINKSRYSGFVHTDTKKYFEKLSGYDTLRLILCKKAILVEGPSDELIVQKAYLTRKKKLPIEDEVM